ncbi:GNAT family N-acetyltransferase [Salinibaculum rarum]|uniref:GNAT family N-acetyltransferase n=1 Tax=Salinibaculum rarum TaxID=3058903 RepID=UPI00265F699B|nr:GNAT family N-acetyltransferase [Salinibaculum sp. KK48]
MTDSVRVRAATVSELPDVLNVVDGAVLAVDTGRLRSAIDRGDVLVAVAGTAETDRILGALVLDGEEITAVAVRKRRQGQGIGTMLVEAAADRRERLVAEFDSRVRPFWESLGFDITQAVEIDRFRGVR